MQNTDATSSTATVTHAMPGARQALALLLAINLLNYVDRYILAAVVPQIKHDFHATDAQAGLLATAVMQW